jgi:hypothetical protein
LSRQEKVEKVHALLTGMRLVQIPSIRCEVNGRWCDVECKADGAPGSIAAASVKQAVQELLPVVITKAKRIAAAALAE